MIFDGKLYLNLEKQVQKNKEDIEYIINEEGALNQFGLRVVGQVESVAAMPTIQAYKESNPKWEYGDAFMAGVSTEEATVVDVEDATLLVLTRANTVYPNDFWMNLGKFPKPGPTGATGATGPQGAQGIKGIGVQSGSADPTAAAPATTTYINATTGDVFVYSGQTWDKIGNIKGATGATGPAGPQGATGPIGPTGAQGPQGPRGIGVNILGTLTSTSQLPDPTTVAKDSAYIIPADGVNHLWVIEGTTSLVWTDFGTAGLGEKGDKGDDGVGINTMTDLDLTYGNTTVTYDTTDGMTINGQARFTYNGGTTKDVTMDIEVPIVAGDGITIDKKANQEKVEVKLDTAFTDGKYVAKTTTNNIVYATGNSGQPENTPFSYNPKEWAFVKFDGTGCLRTNDTTGDDPRQCVNKRQADATYVQKQTTTMIGPSFVYAYDSNGDRQFQITGSYLADTVAYRGTGGRLQVGTPTGVNDATTKAYVDNMTTYLHYFKLTDGTSTILLQLCLGRNYTPTAITTMEGLIAKITQVYEENLELPASGYNATTGKMVYGIKVSNGSLVTLEQQGATMSIGDDWTVTDYIV